MSRQLGFLHSSNCHPANLQTQIPIIPLFAFPPPDFPIINISSSTNSDTNSDISVFHTISQFNNANVETPRRICRIRTISLYPYPDQLLSFSAAPFSTHLIHSSTLIPFHSFLRFPSNPNLFSISFRQITK